MCGSIGPRMEICETLWLPIPMVPCFHQSNGYMKRKLRVWRAQQCIALVDEETVFTSAGRQTTPFHGGQYRVGNGNMRNFGPTNPHGTSFAPKQCLYQKEAAGMESPKVYALVRAKTVLTSAEPQTTPFHGGQYRVLNGNMQNFGPTYRHGTAFPQEECLYQKEATGMENPKMYCCSPWNNPTSCVGLQTTRFHG